MTRSHLPATLRRTSAAAALLLALGSASACGGDDEPEADETASSSATSGGSDESSESGGSDSGAVEGEEIEAADFIEVYGAALDEATTANFSMLVDGPVPAEMSGQMDFTTQPPATRMNLQDPASGQQQELTLVDGSLYVKIPDGKYYRTDLEDGPLGGSAGALDPRALLDTFEQAIISATYLGSEDVDGEDLEHYRIVLDSTAMQQAAGGAELPDAGVPAELTFDAFFGDGLLRRVLLDLGAQGGTVDVRYDDWGTDVEIVAPPASQVQPLPGS